MSDVSKQGFSYFGTSDFSATILNGLISHDLIPELVVTTIGKPQGRKLQISPTPVAEIASKHQLKLLEVKTLRDEKSGTANGKWQMANGDPCFVWQNHSAKYIGHISPRYS